MLEKPTLAMIRGYCMGGGLALAVACDLRFCSEDAQFAIPAARLSIIYREDFLRWVLELIGPSHTKDILYSARRLKSDEALRIGLVNHVVPLDKLEPTVMALALAIAANSRPAVMASKQVIDAATGSSEALRQGGVANRGRRKSGEHRDRFRAAATRVTGDK